MKTSLAVQRFVSSFHLCIIINWASSVYLYDTISVKEQSNYSDKQNVKLLLIMSSEKLQRSLSDSSVDYSYLQ